MRTTAVTVLTLCVAARILIAGGQSEAGRDPWMPITIQAVPVPLNPDDRSQSAVGAFTYAGGLVLTSTQTDRLHGLSDIAMTGDDRLTAVGDDGVFVTARLLFDAAGNLSGVSEGRLMVLTAEDGTPLTKKEDADAEGLAVFPNGDRLVSFERNHRIWLYPADGGPPRAVPKPDVDFPDPNGGMEALAPDPEVAPDAYVVGAEVSGQTWNCRLSTGCVPGRLVPRPTGTSLVAINKLPAGRTAYLFRGFNGRSHIVLQVMRQTIVEGELDLAPPLTVDNIEGVAAVVRPGGVIRFYLMSDDNASSQQRTILLAFDWRPPPA
jgi:hypothetical protein